MKQSFPYEGSFLEWLENTAGYQKTSARSTVRMVRRAFELYAAHELEELLSSKYTPYLRRWVSFAQTRGLHDAFTRAVEEHHSPVEPSPTGPVNTKAPSDKAWRTLIEQLASADSPVDRALYALVLAPHPETDMEDLLKMPIRELQKLLPSEVAPILDKARRAGTLRMYLCPNCAPQSVYHRVWARLKALTQGGMTFSGIEKLPVERRWAVLR
jgi:hypothetical protein